MDFNISKIINGLQYPEWLKKLKDVDKGNKINDFGAELNSSVNNPKTGNTQILQNIADITQKLQMNSFVKADKLIFIRNLLGMPQNMQDVLLTAQNPAKPLLGGTLGMGGINQNLFQNQKILASLFDDMQTIPGVDNLAMQGQTAKPTQDAVALFFSGMVSLPDISKMILQNGKQAVAALIISMASASKQGISNDQLQESLAIINSCISMAEADNPAMTLKSLMMLYLPWLPLNEGVGFDLEVSVDSEGDEGNNSKLTVLIQTKNYGNLKGVFTLTTSNSVDVFIICSEDFPKKMLEKLLKEESSSHAMNTNIDIEEVALAEDAKNSEGDKNQETKVNLSATNEMNPYLLLMVHAFIRNTILIDNSAV